MNYHLFTTLDYGLCNRLRGYVGAWAYAKKMKCTLHVLWTRTPACPYAIEELFEPLPNTRFITAEESAATTYAHTTNDHGHLSHILSKNGIAPSMAPLLIASLVPVEAIRQKLEYISSDVPLNVAIGLHVRRTDHAQYANTVGGATPDEVFWAVASRDSSPLFLACDDRTTQEAFQRRYGARVHTVTNITSSPSLRQTNGEHAVLDLYALALCGTFQGSRMSSFSAHVEYLRMAWAASPTLKLRCQSASPLDTPASQSHC